MTLEQYVEQVGGTLDGALRSARHQWSERWGLWLRLRDAEGRVGVGEASPLPGYTADSLERARLALDSLGQIRPCRSLQEVFDVGARLTSSPSARFAVETALLDLLSQRRRCPVDALLAEALGTAPADIELATLVNLDESASRLDFGTYKAKVSDAADLDKLAMLRQEHPDKRIRIDANQSWPIDQIELLWSRAVELDIELIEEPCAPPSIEGLAPPLPLALDESLQAADALERLPGWLSGLYRVVVLKPTALGGMARCLELARCAKQSGAQVIVSHTFDGPLAMAAAAALSRVLCPTLAQGLAPHAGLSAYPPRELVGLAAGCWRVSDSPGLGVEPEA